VSEGTIKTLVECKTGVVRDPELSFDAQKVIFSMRKNKDDAYSIYEINIDGTGLKQLTFAQGVSDIDPLYLPDGGIIFSSSRVSPNTACATDT
jgi:Tol biopolymer transport system component